MRTVVKRLSKLESSFDLGDGSDFANLTDDEIEIRLYDLARRGVAHPESLDPELVEKLQKIVAEAEEQIVAVARKQASPEYARHLAWLKSMWAQRSPGVEYVCDLFNARWGYGNWEKPNIMDRRRALRERADIAVLVGVGYAASA